MIRIYIYIYILFSLYLHAVYIYKYYVRVYIPYICIYMGTYFIKHYECTLLYLIGNSGGNLSKDWELYWDKSEHPRIQGGFIWDWVDQGTGSMLELYCIIYR